MRKDKRQTAKKNPKFRVLSNREVYVGALVCAGIIGVSAAGVHKVVFSLLETIVQNGG